MATPTSAWASAGRVVGAVAAHGDQTALGLFGPDQAQLVLGRRLGEEVVDPGLRGDGGGGHRVVAGDHHGAQAHAAQVGEPLLHARLDHVLEVDDADQHAVLGHRQRRAARAGDPVHGLALNSAGICASVRSSDFSTASTAPLRQDLPSASRPDCRVVAVKGMAVAPAGASTATPCVAAQFDDRAALGRLVGQRGHDRRRAAPASGRTPGGGDDLGRHAVAEGDGAGLVEQQGVDVAGRLDRAARGRQDIDLQQPVHAGDADGATAGRRWSSGSG